MLCLGIPFEDSPMEPNLLAILFGADRRWSGPCTVILDASAHAQSIGSDAIVQGGIKSFAPRLITGRIPADHAVWLPEQRALVLVKRGVVRQATGEDQVNHTLHVVSASHIAAVEFERLDTLGRFGLATPYAK